MQKSAKILICKNDCWFITFLDFKIFQFHHEKVKGKSFCALCELNNLDQHKLSVF